MTSLNAVRLTPLVTTPPSPSRRAVTAAPGRRIGVAIGSLGPQGNHPALRESQATASGEPLRPPGRRITVRQRLDAHDVTDLCDGGRCMAVLSGDLPGSGATVAARKHKIRTDTHPIDGSPPPVRCKVILTSTNLTPRPRPRTGAAPTRMHAVTASPVFRFTATAPARGGGLRL
jgi:hypothetical protein